jgi:arsenate reductase-like glutaredoxin family protein
MTTLYGIKNFDTVKKARHWLDQTGIATGLLGNLCLLIWQALQ